MINDLVLLMKVFQSIITPFALFGFGLVMLGCQPQTQPDQEKESTAANVEESSPVQVTDPADLKSGNMFYIVRDVADVQLKAGGYIEQIQQLQSDLEQAVNNKDPQKLDQSVQSLKSQLLGFNEALTGLDLKSQEIAQIRSNILTANQNVLASPLLNGQVNLNNIDFAALEKQMGNIHGEMVKLASMLLTQSGSSTENNQAED